MIRTANYAKTVVLSLAAAAIAGAMPAAAQNATADIPHAEMDIAHVDFTSPKAVKALKAQLRRVAAEMCTPFNDGTVHMATEEMQCYNRAVKGGLAQIETRRQLALARAQQITVAANTQVRP
ncbi:UrcA family protein [Novosphingobium sp. SG919]|nr:UrcA family protein [Novosphingobium sp. SG919]